MTVSSRWSQRGQPDVVCAHVLCICDVLLPHVEKEGALVLLLLLLLLHGYFIFALLYVVKHANIIQLLFVSINDVFCLFEGEDQDSGSAKEAQ